MNNTSNHILKDYSPTFWVANLMEIFERMAWYGFFALSSLYITGSVSEGGLGFSSEDRGVLQGVVTFFIYLFPFFTGAIGDRYGYKKMLLISYLILSPAYFLLGQFKTFPTFFAAFMLVGIGASIFKPLIVGTVGKTTNERTSSLGFGIFYMMVNIGGFLGPFVAAAIRNAGWNYVFIASSIWIALNIPILLIFYKEPTEEASSVNKRTFRQVMIDMMEVLGNGRFFLAIFVLLSIFVAGSKWLTTEKMFLYAGIWIFLNIVVDLILRILGNKRFVVKTGNLRFLLFLLLLSSFWIAFNQIFLTLPEYIRDFTDTKSFLTSIVNFLKNIGASETLISKFTYIFAKPDGSIKPEHFVNINALCIIFFQVFVSYYVSRIAPLITIMGGIFITALSFILLSFGQISAIVALSVAIFSFGEMAASPKAKEYTAKAVAPPDKVALYMGYYMWSLALGNLFGGLLSGKLYGWLARDLGKPHLMWLIFASISIFCATLLYFYHKIIGSKVIKKNTLQ